MSGNLFSVDCDNPDLRLISKAAKILGDGGLVAFPTETVYGLGANALDESAVRKIFIAKGRPANNPLIVHVCDMAAAKKLAATWPSLADKLAEQFWPGSLTLILTKNHKVPGIVTGGGNTVALRIPAHPVALALLEKCDLPVAAPSANKSNHLSPTRAEHVQADLGADVDLILGGGPAWGGLESTVLDITCSPPRILRPGLVSPGQLEKVIGPVELLSQGQGIKEKDLRSPGLINKHYAPTKPLECIARDDFSRLAELLAQGIRIAWITFPDQKFPEEEKIRKVVLPENAKIYASQFYASLHQLEKEDVDYLFVTLPPKEEAWLAVRDRLRRATYKLDS